MDQLVAGRGKGHYVGGWPAKPVMTVRRRRMKRGRNGLNDLQKVILVQGGLVGCLVGRPSDIRLECKGELPLDAQKYSEEN